MRQKVEGSVSESVAAAASVRGTVEAVYYAGPTFSAGRLRSENGERVSFAGKVFAREGDRVVFHGKWGRHAKYGEQFEVTSLEYDQTIDAEGLARYLAEHPDIKGIGPAKARAIVDACGAGFDRMIDEEPDRIARSAKVSRATIDILRDEWLRTRAFNATMTRLSAFGLTHHQVTKLVEKLGNSAGAVIESDPYLIVREIPGFGFGRVDKIARQTGTPKDHPGRVRAGIVHCVDEALDRGHTWIEFEDLVGRANLLLVMDTLEARDCIEKTLDEMIAETVLTSISWGGRFLIAKPAIHKMEVALAAMFCGARAANPHFVGLSDVDGAIARVAPSLNEGQRAAIANALAHTITLISGGAGSGKTYAIAALTDLYEECDLQVVLCAPTGKAAKRMEEVVGHEALTIHRLLGFNGHTYSRGPESPIDADVVIVDETSMVDVPLAHRLLQAIDLSRTAVVLVGDHNQLPPVGPGNVLRDLITAKIVPTVILDQVVRQAGVLKENSIAILSGEVKRSAPAEPSGHRAWFVADQFTDPHAAQRFIVELFDGRLAELGFDIARDVQVLTPTHKGPLGTIELNIALQRLIQKKLHHVDVSPPTPGRKAKILLRDRVIQTRNNYDLGLMNGAMGEVIAVEKKTGALTASFDGASVSKQVEGSDLRDLELAYALTIHKAQGSEFPCVIAVIHKAHAFQHHRNLLYTAATRAMKTLILIGDSWGMKNCARRRRTDERNTWLRYALIEKG